jgi:hypothetical protein
MRTSLCVILAVVVATIAWPARAATPQQVEETLAKSKQYVYSQFNKGNWENVAKREEGKGTAHDRDTSGAQWGGLTALSVFALLVAGENPQEQHIAQGIEFLKKADIVGTYALGMRAQVWTMLPQTPEIRSLATRDATKLRGLMKTTDYAKGFYDYDNTGGPKTHSLSRSQYAVLGMWACAQAGAEVPGAYWAEIEKAWNRAQEKDGGWHYYAQKADPPSTAGITAVGVATMFIVQDQLYQSRGVDCKNPLEIPAIDKGIDWMSKHFEQVAPDQPFSRDFPYATLYAVERVGVAGGIKYFGKHDWYQKGSDYLVKKQSKNGSFTGYPGNLPNTCFAMIFLSRGRAPVIFNKLDYVADDKAAAGAWNRRPRDLANVTRWISRTTERDFNWQVMTLDAPMHDWHDAPILYLSGSDPMKIGKKYVEKMRRFCEEGGLVLAHADCGRGGFVATARKLASDMFPSYEFRELPESHPIYTTLYPRSRWKNKPSVLGVSNGVRELMLVIPTADPGKVWQIGVIKGREEFFELGADIVFYAADQRELHFKGESHLVEEDPSIKTSASLKLARLSYKGNWDPEPGGWRRMRGLLRREDKLDLTVSNVELGKGSLDGYKVAHLTGTTKIKLDEDAKSQLKKFVAGGGTLIVDAAGGSDAFASSIEADLTALGTGDKLDAIPPAHSLFGGMKVAYRAFAQKSLGGKLGVPRLKAVRVGDHLGIVFSREDLSAGLVGESVGGVVGYTPGVATQLMRHVLLRAAGVAVPSQKSVASTQPAKPEKKSSKKSKKDEKKSETFDNTGLD